MLGLIISVPVACWRKSHARDYLESELLPPPSTCYGFLLALVGEEDRRRYIGAQVTAGIVTPGAISTVLRTVWRVKSKNLPQGVGNNARPDYQQLICGSRLTVWIDGGPDRDGGSTLEDRVRTGLVNPAGISRFGGLSLGESTHLVDAIDVIEHDQSQTNQSPTRLRTKALPRAQTFLRAERGRLTLPVWVDHIGTAGTRHAVGDWVDLTAPPPAGRLPIIAPS